ncbi:MAG: hypothetical protein Q7T55_01655, partial [Solirubrobacteraceae bacterium]|nr:hypothetical protein [Solirubrobacteraceae bacterium]
MSNLAVLHQQHAPGEADSAFWCPAIGTSSAALADLAHQLDTLAQDVARLPVRAAVTRPVVGQYLSMVRTLAAAWQARARPALGSALAMLAFVGHSMAQPAVLAALQAPGPDQQGGAHALDALRRRMAAPLAALDTLSRDVASYLAQMAR